MSVRHKPVFYGNGGTDQAGFWQNAYPRLIGNLFSKNNGTSLWNFAPELWT